MLSFPETSFRRDLLSVVDVSRAAIGQIEVGIPHLIGTRDVVVTRVVRVQIGVGHDDRRQARVPLGDRVRPRQHGVPRPELERQDQPGTARHVDDVEAVLEVPRFVRSFEPGVRREAGLGEVLVHRRTAVDTPADRSVVVVAGAEHVRDDAIELVQALRGPLPLCRLVGVHDVSFVNDQRDAIGGAPAQDPLRLGFQDFRMCGRVILRVRKRHDLERWCVLGRHRVPGREITARDESRQSHSRHRRLDSTG